MLLTAQAPSSSIDRIRVTILAAAIRAGSRWLTMRLEIAAWFPFATRATARVVPMRRRTRTKPPSSFVRTDRPIFREPCIDPCLFPRPGDPEQLRPTPDSWIVGRLPRALELSFRSAAFVHGLSRGVGPRSAPELDAAPRCSAALPLKSGSGPDARSVGRYRWRKQLARRDRWRKQPARRDRWRKQLASRDR